MTASCNWQIGVILFAMAENRMSTLFLSGAVSIIDYGEVSIPGLGCDSCEFARQFLLNYSIIFGFTENMFGAVGNDFPEGGGDDRLFGQGWTDRLGGGPGNNLLVQD